MNIQKPTLVNAIAWMTLASGIVNLFWGVAASGTALATIVGIFCTPLTILPTILGIFEIIYAAKLFSNPPQAIQPSTNIAIFEIACVITGNVFSMAVGILSLVFYNDVVVKEYFARLNGTPLPAAPSAPETEPASVPTPEPFDPAQDKPAPIVEGPILSEDEGAAPESETSPATSDENPAKPKRTPRKMAGK